MNISRATAILLTAAVACPAAAGQIAGKITCSGLRHSGDAVVWVEPLASESFDIPEEHPVIDQRDMEFVPHVLPVLVGTTVDFLNSDPFMHNVFAPEKCADRFNLGSWAKGQTRSYTFTAPCVASLLCNVHPEMEAFIVVVPTTRFAVTDRDGSFTIPDVPDGDRTVRIWHPKLKEVSRPVTVSGDTTLELTVER